MNKLLGRGILLSYVTGRYHTPREEERVFMFLDLKSSTTIAEETDPTRYHNFLNEFFFDMNEPILETRGEIYQYVGDEVVISWKMKDAIRDMNCVKCFFRIRRAILQKNDAYMKSYGLVPEFKAGLHCGKVIIGEVGDSKKDIVFHGDVMNTASRIQTQCNAFNVSLLISSELLSRLRTDHAFKIERIGKIKLKGKQREVELYSVSEADV